MAGDWLLIRKELLEDPKVVAIAMSLGIPAETVVGKLVRVWGWADSHTIRGIAPHVTFNWISSYAGCSMFAEALAKVGWLRKTEAGVEFPNFEEYNLETAKQRALTARRNARLRGKRAGPVTQPVTHDASPTEQNRTEQKKEPSSLRSEGSPEAGKPPSGEPADEVVLTFETVGKVKSWDLVASHVKFLRDTFPAVDVLGESKRALAWTLAKPERRKTVRGMKAFLLGWMGRSQNRGGTVGREPSLFGGNAEEEAKRKEQERLDRIVQEQGEEYRRRFGDRPQGQE